MDWIRVDISTLDKPEVYLIAEHTGLEPDAVVGKLLRVWAWFDMQTTDGRAPVTLDRYLCNAVGCADFTKAMVSVGWLTIDGEHMEIPRFLERHGKTAKNRALSARRQAQHRAKSNAQSNEPVTMDRNETRYQHNTTINNTPLPPTGGPVGLVEIPLKSGGVHLVPPDDLADYQATFPGLDVPAELRRLARWNVDNPRKRKTPGGIRRHIYAWLTSASDKAKNTPKGGRHGTSIEQSGRDYLARKRAEIERGT